MWRPIWEKKQQLKKQPHKNTPRKILEKYDSNIGGGGGVGGCGRMETNDH